MLFWTPLLLRSMLNCWSVYLSHFWGVDLKPGSLCDTDPSFMHFFYDKKNPQFFGKHHEV